MPYYSRIILNSFYNRLFPKLFRHNRRMPTVENGVCEYVGIDSKYKDDKEVKRLITILDDRRRIQNVRNHKLCCTGVYNLTITG